MGREKRQIYGSYKEGIKLIIQKYGPDIFNDEIPDSKFNEFDERMKGSASISFLNRLYFTDAVNIETYLIEIYEIYKKNPKYFNILENIDFNKLENIDFELINEFFLNTKKGKRKIDNHDELKLVWDSFIPFPKLSFLSFYYFYPPGRRRSLIHTDFLTPSVLQKSLEMRKKILSFLEFFFPYPLLKISTEKTTADISTQTNIDLKCISLYKMKEEQVWEKLFPKTNINRDEKKRIYDNFHKNYPGDDFYKYIKGFNDINPNYDWKKYISVFLPHILHTPGSFPKSLELTVVNYPIPGTIFNLKPAPILNEFKISVAADQSFPVKFRNIFKDATVTFNSAQQSRSWLGGPNINYWPQQLNFAVWCATSGCGVSLNEKYPKRVQQFINFHVYFTIRRILYELGAPLPGDSIFQQTGNHHNVVAFQRLCQEFNLPENPDFRYKGGKNHGLGTIYVRNGGSGRWIIPSVSSGLVDWPNRSPIFHDEHGIAVVGEIGGNC